MTHRFSIVGFAVIVSLYAAVGIMAAVGAIVIARKVFAPKVEQIFFAIFLSIIAGFYLAFAAYFEAATAWSMEVAVVVAFMALSVAGVRFPLALMVGYPLHGVWDLLHELQAHGVCSAFEPGQITQIPLAYGVFCASFDLCMGVYIYARRREWIAAWKTSLF
jgi:hypothetical protein